MVTTNAAAREVVLVPRELPHGLYLTSCQPHIGYGESWRAYYQKWWDNILEKVALTPQQGGEQEARGAILELADKFGSEYGRRNGAQPYWDFDEPGILAFATALRSKQAAPSEGDGQFDGELVAKMLDDAALSADMGEGIWDAESIREQARLLRCPQDVAEYQYRTPKAHDSSWTRMTKAEYDATLATGHACGQPTWTRDVEIRKLYTDNTSKQEPQ